MGTWEGHISPGVAFYFFGVAYCLQYSIEHLLPPTKLRKSNRLEKYFDNIQKLPVLGFMKVLFGFGAAMAELFYPPGTNNMILTYPNGSWAHLPNWQHFTMYMSFFASGIVDMISEKCLKKRIIELEKAVVAAAILITGLLLFFHKEGNAELMNEAHGLLLYTNIGLFFIVAIEIWHPYEPRLLWSHTILIMQMGSWLLCMAFILFDHNGHEKWGSDAYNSEALTLFYSWNIFLNALVMTFIFIAVFVYRKLFWKNTYYQFGDNDLECCNLTSKAVSMYNGDIGNQSSSLKGNDETSPFLSDHETYT